MMNRLTEQELRSTRPVVTTDFTTRVDGNVLAEPTAPDSLLQALAEEPAFNTLWKKVERGCQDVLNEPFAQRNLMVYSQELYRLASNKCTRVPMLTRGTSEQIQAKDDIAQQYLVLYYLLRDLFKSHLAKVAPVMADSHRKTAKRFAFENSSSAGGNVDAVDVAGGTVPEDRLALIKQYCIQWGRFAESIRKIKAIFSYVHNHWHTLDINNHKTPFDAQTMACTLWGENAMDMETKRALGEATIEIIHRDRLRNMPTVDYDISAFSPQPMSREMRIVQRCLSCLLELNIVHSRPQATYVDWFEKPLEEKIRTFFETEAKKHSYLLLPGNATMASKKPHITSSANLIKYLRMVRGWLDMEQHRAELCMAESTKVSIRSIILTQFGFVPPRKDDPSGAISDRHLFNQILVGSVLRCARYARLNIDRTTFDIDCSRFDSESGERLFHRVDDTIANELLERHIKATHPNPSSLSEAQLVDLVNSIPFEESNTIIMREVSLDYKSLELYCRMLTFLDSAVASFANQFSKFVQDEVNNAIDYHVFGSTGKEGAFAIQELLQDPSILTSAQLSIFVRYSTLIEQVFQGSVITVSTALEQAMSAVLNKNSVIEAAAIAAAPGSTTSTARTSDGRACEFLARYFHSLLCTVTASKKINTLSDAEFNIKVRFSCTLLHHLQEPEHFRTHYQFLLMRRLLYSPSYAPCNVTREQFVIDRIASARSTDFVHLFNLMIKEAPQTSGMANRVTANEQPMSTSAPHLSCSTDAEVVLSLLGQYGWPQSRELSEANRDLGGGMPYLRLAQPVNPNDPLAADNPHRLFPQKDASAYPLPMAEPMEARLAMHKLTNIKKEYQYAAPLSHGDLSFSTRDGGKATLLVSYTQMRLLEAFEAADNQPNKKSAVGCTFAEMLERINGKARGAATVTTSAQQTQEDENDIIKALFPLVVEGVVEIASNPAAQSLFASNGISRAEFTSQRFVLAAQWPQPSLANGSVVDAFCWYVLHPISPASASAALSHFVTCPKETNVGLEAELREKLMKMTMLGGRLYVPDSGLPQFLVDILPTKLIDGTRHIVGNAPGSGARPDGARPVGIPSGGGSHKRETLIRSTSLQATIMTLMKRNGTMTFNDIRDDTSRKLTKEFTGFELEAKDFKAGLEKLISNGYIVRSPTNPAEFTYQA